MSEMSGPPSCDHHDHHAYKHSTAHPCSSTLAVLSAGLTVLKNILIKKNKSNFISLESNLLNESLCYSNCPLLHQNEKLPPFEMRLSEFSDQGIKLYSCRVLKVKNVLTLSS